MQTDTRSEDMLPVLPNGTDVDAPIRFTYDALLPKAGDLNLSQSQVDELAAFEASLVILGPAAGSVLVCPGNQEDLTDDRKCPYAAKCPLLRMKKAPEGKLCPIERTIIEQRFSGWCKAVGQEPDQLTEDMRALVADLTWMDLQIQRCVNILSAGEAARMTQVNVTEAVNYTNAEGEQTVLPLTWERVLHVNTERLDNLQDRRRMLLKDAMLNNEQRWRIQKAEGNAKGTDLGSQQASRAAKLRAMDPTYDG
jgi:hypothetical protein